MYKQSRSNNSLVITITFNNLTAFSSKYFRNAKIITHQTPSCLVCGEFKAANVEYPRLS